MVTSLPRLTLSLGLLLGLGALILPPGLAQDSSTGSDTGEPTPSETPDSTGADEPTAAETPRFSCQVDNGQYTVMYSPQSQPDQAYPWAVPEDMGSAWPAERRCTTIAQRLEQYRPDGLLELQTAVENGYNTVCVTTEAVPGCRIVFTVPPGQDPLATRDRVFQNLTLADRGEATQGVNTFTDGDGSILDQVQDVLGLPNSSSRPRNGGINLKPFLDAADGGTGTQLSGGSASPTLNPNNFRWLTELRS